MMYVEHIVQQVQYKFYVWFHHMLPLSLACRIMGHVTQNYHKYNLVLMQLHCLHMYFHGKTEYHGSTYANNVVALETGWIRDNFEFCES